MTKLANNALFYVMTFLSLAHKKCYYFQ